MEGTEKGHDTHESRSSRWGGRGQGCRPGSAVADDLTRRAQKAALNRRLSLPARQAEGARPPGEISQPLVLMKARHPEEVELQRRQQKGGDGSHEPTIDLRTHRPITIAEVRQPQSRFAPMNTTNTAFSDWGNILFNTTIATAIADRLVENSEIERCVPGNVSIESIWPSALRDSVSRNIRSRP
jgi:hypothetical protein